MSGRRSQTVKRFGILLVLVGVIIAITSEKIVFPGLELLLGPEVIVGRNNVHWLPGGQGYLMTNPAAMIHWIWGVAAIGLLLICTGVAVIFRAQRKQ